MISVAITTEEDPSGLNGQRIVLNAKSAPYIVEVYSYPATVAFDVIKSAWLKVLPLGSSAGFKEEGIRGGKRLVKIDRFERPAKPPVHIEEPLDV